MKNDVFKTRCPNCLSEYELNVSFKNRRAICQKCRSTFVTVESAVDAAPFPTAASASADRAFAPDVDSLLFSSPLDDVGSRSTSETTESTSDSCEISDLPPEFATATFPDPPPGVWRAGEKILDGAYQALPFSSDKLYAEGGVGLVQRVRRLEWNLDFVVKSPKPGVVTSEEGKKSFERECETWIGLGLCPNIVSCYFVRRIDGVPRLFAEFAPDGTLRDWIADGRLYAGTPKEALARILDAAIQFAWGLEHAHRQGVLHLDVKPSNVMTSGTTIKVTDFGLSRVARSTDGGDDFSTDLCDGMTPSYCSPEQYEAFQIYRQTRERQKKRENGGANSSNASDLPPPKTVPITRQSDIWSWAISVLAMFHGRSPCKLGGQTAAEVFEAFLQAPPSDKRPPIPAPLVDVLRRCFRKNPAERPATMQEVADRLVEIYATEIGEKHPRRQLQNAASTAQNFSNRAVSLIDLGKIAEAVELLRQASAVAPFQPQIAFNRTLALWRTGEIRDVQAVDRLVELTKNRPRDATALYALGLIQLERCNVRAAIETFRNALALAPSRDDVRQAIDRSERRLSRDAVCLDRRVLRPGENGKVPPLFVDDSDDFILVPLDGARRVVLNAKSGLSDATENANSLRATFFKSDAAQFDFEPPYPKTVAVSEDYRWKLVATGPKSAFVGLASQSNEQIADEKRRLRFAEVDWGTFGPVEVAIESKAENGIAKRLAFLPRPTGVAVVDVATGDELGKLATNGETLTALAVSADGRWAATGGDDAKIAIWDVERGRCVRTFGGLAGAIEALWFDPKARFVLSLTKGSVFQYWRVDGLCRRASKSPVAPLLCLIETSEELGERQERFDEILNAARDADAAGDVEKVAALYRRVRKIDGWESTRREFERSLDPRATRSKFDDAVQTFSALGCDGPISALAAAWNGCFVVSAGKDGAIRLWGRPANEPETQGADARFAAQNLSDASNDWKVLRELSGHSDWIRSIAISPNGRFLVSGGWDQNVYLWDLATGRRLRALSSRFKSVSQVAFAPDGRTVAVATELGEASLWDGATGEPIFRRRVGSGAVRTLRFNRDGRYLTTACDDGTVRFWNGRGTVPRLEISNFPASIAAVDLTCDARLLAVGCENGKIYLVDLTDPTGKTRRELHGHLGGVRSVDFFLDSDWLASTGKDQTARIWNARDAVEAKTVEVGVGEIAAASLDFVGRTLFVGGKSGALNRWNLHWDYAFPGRVRSREEIARTVAALAAFYSIGSVFERRRVAPAAYYGANGNGVSRFSEEFPLDETVLNRVRAEAARRGFGAVPRETIQEIARALWRSKAPTFVF